MKRLIPFLVATAIALPGQTAAAANIPADAPAKLAAMGGPMMGGGPRGGMMGDDQSKRTEMPADAPGKPGAMGGMGMVADKQMTQMQENMKKMQEQMDRVRTTVDPNEHRKLMREHMQTMQENMQIMRGMGGPMMGGGPHGGMITGGDQTKRMDMMENRMDMMQMMMEQMMQHEQTTESVPSK